MKHVALTVCAACILPLMVCSESYGSRDECNCCHGAAGIPGIHGLPGQQGKDGRAGDKGDKGRIGEPGNMGVKGEVGNRGLKGSRGRKGKKGECGAKGNLGIAGVKGDRGYNGYKGDRGIQGEPAKPLPKVAFSAARSKKLGPVLQDTTVTFDQVFTNIGESFDEYTSHFICKINGTYFFTVHVLGQLKVNAFAWIMMNNKHRVPLHGDGRAGYGTGANSIILSLVTDDHVWIQLTQGSALLNDYCTFSGYLLFLE